MGDDGEEREAAIGAAPNGLPEIIILGSETDDLPSLAAGEIIGVDWPAHSGFEPRSLSSNPSGTQLVVADDLGVYAGRLVRVSLPPGTIQGQDITEVSTIHFHRVPPCTALEGQALQDVAVACDLVTDSICRVVVLHSQGRHLSECPLPILDESELKNQKLITEKVWKEASEKVISWEISAQWLHVLKNDENEHVDALAVNSECLRGASYSENAFRAEPAGCVVVGTSAGRIVQLRGAHVDPQRLVPARAMQERQGAITRGSIQVTSQGFVLVLRRARKGPNTVQAFNSKSGRSVGEWRLPVEQGLRWLTLGAGGHKIFALANRNGEQLELHEFPIPEELQRNSLQQVTSQNSGLQTIQNSSS